MRYSGTEPPQWVLAQMEERLRTAEQAYECVKTSCEALGMTKEEYVASYLGHLPPLTWTSTITSNGSLT